MRYLTDAAALWLAPSGVIDGAVVFELVPALEAWMIVLALLGAVCAALSIVANPRRALPRHRRMHIVRGGAKRHPRPMHARKM